VLLGCSTLPSVTVISPVIDVPKLVIKAPVAVTTQCSPLREYMSTATRDIVRTTVENHNIYYMCASKMKAAANYIKQNEDENP
jgi:hypothetical protein